MNSVRFKEVFDRIYIYEDVNWDIILVEIISQLKCSGVCRFEVVGLIFVVDRSNKNIFDKYVDIDFFFVYNDVD